MYEGDLLCWLRLGWCNQVYVYSRAYDTRIRIAHICLTTTIPRLNVVSKVNSPHATDWSISCPPTFNCVIRCQDFDNMKYAFDRLALNDAAFSYEPENSSALGLGSVAAEYIGTGNPYTTTTTTTTLRVVNTSLRPDSGMFAVSEIISPRSEVVM